jgi:hypothetical protein
LFGRPPRSWVKIVVTVLVVIAALVAAYLGLSIS